MTAVAAYVLGVSSSAPARKLLQIPLIPGDVVDTPQDQLPTADTSEGVESLASAFDSGDTAWMLTSTALVLLMAIPGLALFYGGLVRPKNVLNAASNVFATVAIVTLVRHFRDKNVSTPHPPVRVVPPAYPRARRFPLRNAPLPRVGLGPVGLLDRVQRRRDGKGQIQPPLVLRIPYQRRPHRRLPLLVDWQLPRVHLRHVSLHVRLHNHGAHHGRLRRAHEAHRGVGVCGSLVDGGVLPPRASGAFVSIVFHRVSSSR